MTTSTTGTSGIKEQVPYLHSTKKNYEGWKTGFDSTISKHTDSLLNVVQEYKIAKSVLIKIRMQYKTLGEEWDATSNSEHLAEFNTKAWYIMMPTIQDPTMRKTLERKYGDKHDCHGAYAELAEHWNTTATSTTDGGHGWSCPIGTARCMAHLEALEQPVAAVHDQPIVCSHAVLNRYGCSDDCTSDSAMHIQLGINDGRVCFCWNSRGCFRTICAQLLFLGHGVVGVDLLDVTHAWPLHTKVRL